jgi:uroporphyrinogen-III synthase
MSPTGLPLAGQRVVVTRSRAQASSLVERLTALGATTVELPVIAVEAAPDGGVGLAEAATRLVGGTYAWVAFTSVNAVGGLLAALDPHRPPDGVQWAAVGPGTARALTAGGFPPDLVPPSSVSDQLAEAFPAAPPTGGAVLFPRAETVRGALADGLRAKGWVVDEVVAYRTVTGAPDTRAAADARGAEAVAFTSSSTVDRTIELLGVEGVPPVVVTIGPVTSASARAAGLQVAAEATEATIDGLAAAVVSALGGPDQGHQQQ